MKLVDVLLGRWRRRVDRGALERTLAEPVSPETAALPFERSLPFPPATGALIGHVFMVGIILFYGSLEFGFGRSVLAIARRICQGWRIPGIDGRFGRAAEQCQRGDERRGRDNQPSSLHAASS
jgi:hypothetical protein